MIVSKLTLSQSKFEKSLSVYYLAATVILT